MWIRTRNNASTGDRDFPNKTIGQLTDRELNNAILLLDSGLHETFLWEFEYEYAEPTEGEQITWSLMVLQDRWDNE